ncbi:MAG: hypothetical protein IT381_21840 [Deltaproteobacteria bacterium]|nr:hypothetical protein [Deltaproteobacteria bacterium]
MRSIFRNPFRSLALGPTPRWLWIFIGSVFFALFSFERGLGLLHLLKPSLLGLHPIGQLITALVAAVLIVVATILSFCTIEPRFALQFELRNFLFHPAIAHGAVLGCACFDLRAVERHVSELGQAGLLRHEFIHVHDFLLLVLANVLVLVAVHRNVHGFFRRAGVGWWAVSAVVH